MSINLENAFNLVLKLHSRAVTIERPGSSEIVSGIVPSTSISLISTLSEGLAYVAGNRVEVIGSPIAYTASKDTYLEITSLGFLSYVEAPNGSPAPAVVGTNLRVAKVVTDATAVVSVTMLKTPKPIYGINPTNIRVTSSNYFRHLASVEETVISGREFVVSKKLLDSVNYPLPKRGDRIKDVDMGVSVVSEIREMMGLGGAIVGYRLRTS